MPEIKNPVLATENFNRHWDQRRYANFRNRIQSYAQTVKRAKDEPSAGKANEIWRELFGESFGKGGGSGSSSGRSGAGSGGNRTGQRSRPSAPAVAPAASIPVARRQNEARGFG